MAKCERKHAANDTGAEGFRTTSWSVVLLAGQDGTPQAAEALEQLCRAYWYPLYAYVRRRGYPVHEAQDLGQGFFASFLEKHYLANADPQKGRFRSYVLTALNHYILNQCDRAHAAKRGGRCPVLSLDDAAAEDRYRLEPAVDLSPDKLYERRWAQCLLDQALGRFGQEFEAAGKAPRQL